MRINKAVFRYIEFELYNYEQTKKDLELERERILESSPCQEVAVQSDLGDATANKAIKLTTSANIIKNERVINSIDKAISILGDKYKKIFELKYIDDRPPKEVWLMMGVSAETYYRYRRELITMVGQVLGLLNVE